jgi:hypothetical protein
VSTASRNCRFHVQRLRGWGNYAPQSSGRRGQDPGVLRPLCPTWQSNPSGKPQTPCDLGQCESDPLSENAAFQRRKSRDIPAAFTISPQFRHSRAGGNPRPTKAWTPAFAGVTVEGDGCGCNGMKSKAYACRASSQTPQTPLSTRICRLEARTGTSPPPSFLQQPRAPP